MRGDEACQAQALNLILRCYVFLGDYEQAAAFVSRTTFPENATNNQYARHLYYLGMTTSYIMMMIIGLIHAVRGSYHVAADLLNESVRRGPQSPSIAIGFQQSVQKLLVVVLLLSGELPERSLFEKSAILDHSLQPYFSLVQGSSHLHFTISREKGRYFAF